MSALALFETPGTVTADAVEAGARRAYEATMTMRGAASLPFEPWEKLPEHWRRIYRVQARAVLTDPTSPISSTEEADHA